MWIEFFIAKNGALKRPSAELSLAWAEDSYLPKDDSHLTFEVGGIKRRFLVLSSNITLSANDASQTTNAKLYAKVNLRELEEDG